MTRYWIESVESKRPGHPNKWHERVTGKICTVETLDWCGMAYLLVEGIVNHRYGDMLTRYRTSPVLKTEEKDGVLTIETENSVYVLREVLV